MGVITLTSFDLLLAFSMIILLGVFTYRLNLGNTQQLFVAAVRNLLQLLLLGYILNFVFDSQNIWFIGLISIIMLVVAGWEINLRQKYRLKKNLGFKIGVLALFISSFTLTWIALQFIIIPDPWYHPQYAIPLLGMLLGNTMNGISLGMDKLNHLIYQQRYIIEQRLMLGEESQEVIHEIRNDAIRTGMIPIINSMAIAGIVSLPGLMTGQILSGTAPAEAVKYQILIFYMISAGTGFGIIFAVWQISKKMFDERQRLLIEQLKIS